MFDKTRWQSQNLKLQNKVRSSIMDVLENITKVQVEDYGSNQNIHLQQQ